MSSRGSYFYEDEDEVDIRFTRQRSRSPAPRLYQDTAYRHTRPPYYETHSSGHGYIQGSGQLLIPAVSGGLHRSRSQGQRPRRSPTPPPRIQPQQPIVINNRIYNDRDEEEDYHLQLAPINSHGRHHSHSRSRPGSFVGRDPRDDYELDKTRQELAAYKLEKERKEEEKRIKKELELERLRKEKEEDEEEELRKEAGKAAIEKYKHEEAEKAAKAKKEKEEREKEYQHRLEDDLRKSGIDQRQIALVLNKEKQVDPNRPTYTRMSRRHLSIETLNRYRLDYEFDADPDYVLIKRWVPEYEQDFLWSHTREIRERRTVLLTIEGKKKKKDEVEFEFVRKKKHERKPSPSGLLTFLAGGKR